MLDLSGPLCLLLPLLFYLCLHFSLFVSGSLVIFSKLFSSSLILSLVIVYLICSSDVLFLLKYS